MLFNAIMKTCDEIRRDNLKLLIKAAGSEFLLAEKYGCTEANIKTMARAYKDSKSGTPKGIGTAAARKLEKVMDQEIGWLDHDHSQESVAPTIIQEPRSNDAYASTIIPFPNEQWISDLLAVARLISDAGRQQLIGMAKALAKEMPRTKANPSN